MSLTANTAIGAPGNGMPQRHAPPTTPLPGGKESAADRIVRLTREIARAEGQSYLGDPIKHPDTGAVIVKSCGSSQPNPFQQKIEWKAANRKLAIERAELAMSGKSNRVPMSDGARQLARLGFPSGDDKFDKKSEQREAFVGRGFSPDREARAKETGLTDNNRNLCKEWAYIQAIQPKMRLKAEEVHGYDKWRGSRFFKEAAFDEVSAAEQKRELMEEKARKNAEVLG